MRVYADAIPYRFIQAGFKLWHGVLSSTAFVAVGAVRMDDEHVRVRVERGEAVVAAARRRNLLHHQQQAQVLVA